MSRNSSIESLKHAYQRDHAWINGIGDARPLIDSFTDRVALGKDISPRQRIMNMLQNTDRMEWTKRPDNFREVNGYPKD
jgi:hypothetical protein